MKPALILLNSITDVDGSRSGDVAVSGSHGGHYPASIASRSGLRAVIFNDAGRGYQDAGIAGVDALAGVGMAAASADCITCRIGSADDMMANGLISHVNAIASAHGIARGMPVARAADLLRGCPVAAKQLEPMSEGRREVIVRPIGSPVLMVDSASLVGPEDSGRVIVTGSHGGLIGADPSRALKARASLAVFNDAGFGKDRVGISRLPALQELGVAALTVSHDSARIGEASSALETGIVSACNAAAAQLGFRTGEKLATQLGSGLIPAGAR